MNCKNWPKISNNCKKNSNTSGLLTKTNKMQLGKCMKTKCETCSTKSNRQTEQFTSNNLELNGTRLRIHSNKIRRRIKLRMASKKKLCRKTKWIPLWLKNWLKRNLKPSRKIFRNYLICLRRKLDGSLMRMLKMNLINLKDNLQYWEYLKWPQMTLCRKFY